MARLQRTQAPRNFVSDLSGFVGAIERLRERPRPRWVAYAGNADPAVIIATNRAILAANVNLRGNVASVPTTASSATTSAPFQRTDCAHFAHRLGRNLHNAQTQTVAAHFVTSRTTNRDVVDETERCKRGFMHISCRNYGAELFES